MTKEQLKQWRKDKGWTQQVLADNFRISQRAVSFWEQGRRRIPGWLPKMCIYWGICDIIDDNYDRFPESLQRALDEQKIDAEATP